MSTGSKGQLTLAPWTTLLDALRNHLDLTGTNEGCDSACTVPVDGRSVNSCPTLAVMKDGSNITMFEGLTIEDVLHPLRQPFIDHDAVRQVRFALRRPYSPKTRRRASTRSGNFCRCGAYPNIVAVNAAPNQPAEH
jgi:xanthine dehydrogenase YagT iron-sulfur-binding subunit